MIKVLVKLGDKSLWGISPPIQVRIRPLKTRGCLDLWQKLSSENCGLWDGGLTVTLAPQHLVLQHTVVMQNGW